MTKFRDLFYLQYKRYDPAINPGESLGEYIDRAICGLGEGDNNPLTLIYWTKETSGEFEARTPEESKAMLDAIIKKLKESDATFYHNVHDYLVAVVKEPVAQDIMEVTWSIKF